MNARLAVLSTQQLNKIRLTTLNIFRNVKCSNKTLYLLRPYMLSNDLAAFLFFFLPILALPI